VEILERHRPGVKMVIMNKFYDVDQLTDFVKTFNERQSSLIGGNPGCGETSLATSSSMKSMSNFEYLLL